MVSFSVAWVAVTIVKQREVKEFEFNPLIFLLTGLIDLAIVSAVANAFAG
mgnify:CR=1 FL=1